MYSKISLWTLFFILAIYTESLHARLLASPEEILSQSFPEHSIVKKNILLTSSEYKAALKLAHRPFKGRVFRFYQVIDKDKSVKAVAGLLTRKIRTKDMTALYVLTPTGKLVSIEMVAFYEPPEYLPNKKWLSTFKEKDVAAKLKVKSDIPKITGATMTANSVTDSAKVILGIFNSKKNDLVKAN